MLVNQRVRNDVRLIVVSGETGKGSFPGGGQGESYIGYAKRLTRELRLEERVIFTGYLANDDPLLEEILRILFVSYFRISTGIFHPALSPPCWRRGSRFWFRRFPCFDEYERLTAFEEKEPRGAGGQNGGADGRSAIAGRSRSGHETQRGNLRHGANFCATSKSIRNSPNAEPYADFSTSVKQRGWPSRRSRESTGLARNGFRR